MRQTLTKTWNVFMDIQIMFHKMYWLLGFQKKNWFFCESPQALEIDPCTRTTICNTCEQINMSSDIFNAGRNFEEQEDYRFTVSLKKKNL